MGERCSYHDDLTRRAASTDARLANLECWVESIAQKMDRHHREMTISVSTVNDAISRAKGAGWLLIKVGSAAVALAGVGAAIYHALDDWLKGGVG